MLVEAAELTGHDEGMEEILRERAGKGGGSLQWTPISSLCSSDASFLLQLWQIPPSIVTILRRGTVEKSSRFVVKGF